MLSDWNIVANDDGSVTFTPKEEDIRAATKTIIGLIDNLSALFFMQKKERKKNYEKLF